jgi:alpha-galactosidase
MNIARLLPAIAALMFVVTSAALGADNPAVADTTAQTNAEILTPQPGPSPRINGPAIVGARPGSPFLYTIPATGDRPMTFSADSLPKGLAVDSVSGQISGSVAATGDYRVTLRAVNSAGKADKPIRIVIGDTLALTPPMGWNSWECWGESVNQDKVLKAAQALVRTGLVNHGWTYVNIDDTWQAPRGGEFNAIQPQTKRFPDLPALVQTIHQLGLKAGIYSTPWVTSYAGKPGGSAENPDGAWQPPPKHGPYRRNIMPYAIGPYTFETQDAKQWAAWGIDYLKYDWGPVELPESQRMSDALRASGRDIVFSISNNTSGNIFGEIAQLSQVANSWRTTTDIYDNWKSVCSNGFPGDKWAPFSGPGHWNDPDMLVVGWVGWGHPRPTHLTADEQYSHMSLWCLLAAPLLLGCDLDKLDPFTLNLLTNDEVLAVDQDALGHQATKIVQEKDASVYGKTLEDGSWAIGLFNRATSPQVVSVKWSDLKLSGSVKVRDLWRQKDLGVEADGYSTTVNPHGVVLLKITPAS